MLCRSRLLLAGAAWLSIFAIEARGQADREDRVYFPQKTPPAEPLRYDNGADMRLIVVVKGAAILDRPASQGVPKIIAQPPYFAPLVAYTQTSDEQYYLVKNPRTEKWGWIAKEFVLDANEPLRDEDPSNPAFLKVVVRNNWRTETGHLIQAAPILNGPGPEYDKMGQVNIFRIRYAYSIRTATNGNEYVLVGRDPDLHPEVPANTLDGWIPREYVILWPGAVAVSYNKYNLSQRHEPVVFFHNQAHLKSYLETGGSQYAIGRENVSVAKGIRDGITRFPVLDQAGDHLKVVFIGGVLNYSTKEPIRKEVESIYGTQVTTYMQRIMKEHGLSDEAINLALFSQLCIEGWVSKQSRNQDNQLEPWVLIDRTSMDEFLGIIAGIHSRAKRYVAEGLGKSVQAVIERASGDPIKEGKLISEYLQRRYHLPYKNISSVLQYTPYQREEKFAKGTEFKKRFVKDLGQKYALLQSMVEEKEIELQWDEEKIEWRRLNAKKKERWWETGLGGRSFAWLPMDYLP